MRIHSFIFISVILSVFSASGEDILPKGWLTPEQLEQAEAPIQDQLDTGRGMGGSAWSMAAVKDARLLLIYLEIYERLPDQTSRNKFLSEQQEWLKQRQKAVTAKADPDGGTMVRLDQAATKMEFTDKRIATLQKRLDKMNSCNKKESATIKSDVSSSHPSVTETKTTPETIEFEGFITSSPITSEGMVLTDSTIHNPVFRCSGKTGTQKPDPNPSADDKTQTDPHDTPTTK
jgi:uncharacterized protein YecT (DUF1311 family)